MENKKTQTWTATAGMFKWSNLKSFEILGSENEA